ncbi:uncharacterized protein LOC124120084 isoform X2 [Haliotis rufescens]|uniref:uncharacterized protein LOC124120084 isoform X2 n=1 Tax=Haliotis rufescens TaxID=6454 RepID=UPI00201F74DB|nr:uncharacterized protein LOC124120084 isoform X2 [Haliotis rufescens]
MADTIYRDPAPRWTILHPEHWTTAEVAGWVDSVARANNVGEEDHHMISQAFETVTGNQLIAMKRGDFINTLGNTGEFMYQTFRTMFIAVPNLDDKGIKDTRSLTPISEKTDSDSSPEPDPDSRQEQHSSQPTASSHQPEHREGGNSTICSQR